jgi:hypothetical protein
VPSFAAARGGLMRRDVIIAIVLMGLLGCLLLPWLLRQQATSKRLICERRQGSMGSAIREFEATVGHFPAYRNVQAIDADGQEQWTGWVFPLLPYLRPPREDSRQAGPRRSADEPTDGDGGAADAEPQPLPAPLYVDLYAQYGPDGPDATRGKKPTRYLFELVCPADPPPDPAATPNWSDWVANTAMPDALPSPDFPADWPANGVCFDLVTPGGVGTPGMVTAAFIEAHDGLDNTLLLTENVDSGTWTDHHEFQVGFVWIAELQGGVPDPGDALLRINQRTGRGDGSLRFARPSSHHVGGVNVVFASGASQFLSEQIDYLVFARLMMSDSRDVKIPGSDSPVPKPYRLAD